MDRFPPESPRETHGLEDAARHQDHTPGIMHFINLFHLYVPGTCTEVAAQALAMGARRRMVALQIQQQDE